jgi:hypothetical protein
LRHRRDTGLDQLALDDLSRYWAAVLAITLSKKD